MTRDNAFSMMISVLVFDGSSLSMLGSSFIPYIDMTRKKGMFVPPLLTLGGNLIYPSLVHGSSYSSAIVPTLITTGLMSHISVNCSSLLCGENFDELTSTSSAYAFTQVYMKLGIYDCVRDLMRRRRETSYRPISE